MADYQDFLEILGFFQKTREKARGPGALHREGAPGGPENGRYERLQKALRRELQKERGGTADFLRRAVGAARALELAADFAGDLRQVYGEDWQTRFLLEIRPRLDEKRRERADALLKITEISAVFETIETLRAMGLAK
ncbi:MAG: hypothetical protein LBU36_08750 [Clostridiales bacterium]|nr:hypothetical protein [Clostridiales bacterium]